MKYCSNCGTQLPDQAKFCEKCGAPQQSVSRPAEPSNNNVEPEDKTIGQKMKDNFKANMQLQAERRKTLFGKWWFWALLAVALAYFMGACTEPKTPQQEDLEAFVKQNLKNPDTYEFEYMGIEKEYTYYNALTELREGLLKQAQKPGADTVAYQKLNDEIQRALDDFSTSVACREYSLNFSYKDGQNGTLPMKGVAVARYDADGKPIIMTMRPDTLPTYPALHILRAKGYLNGVY